MGEWCKSHSWESGCKNDPAVVGCLLQAAEITDLIVDVFGVYILPLDNDHELSLSRQHGTCDGAAITKTCAVVGEERNYYCLKLDALEVDFLGKLNGIQDGAIATCDRLKPAAQTEPSLLTCWHGGRHVQLACPRCRARRPVGEPSPPSKRWDFGTAPNTQIRSNNAVQEDC